jgi:hypothetical protein
MSVLYTYNGSEMVCMWGEINLMPGRAKDEFISVSQIGEDPIQSEVDVDGNVTLFASKDNRHSITLTLRQESPVNDLLSAALAGAQFGDLALFVKPLTIKDPRGRTTIFDQNCIVCKRPTTTFGEKPGTRQWMFIGADTDRVEGGSISVGG